MKYIGDDDFHHDKTSCVGILLVNLGTPDAPTRGSLRKYLKEFLSDPRVVEVPRLLWWLILNVVILNIRPRRSAALYRKVWTDSGSPLLVHSIRQTESLQNQLNEFAPLRVQVELGMRYGNPSVGKALNALRKAGARKIVVLPLYPQYSGSTVGSVFDAVSDILSQWRWVPELHFLNSYHDRPSYIDALAQKIRGYWASNDRGEHLLMSFHGVPQRYLMAGDPYHCQCHKTARLVADALQLDAAEWTTVFQSRFGREPWLQPYCDETLKNLGNQGVKSVDVVCPGFASDCLETLEEINVENRALFLNAGGQTFQYIPCLNDDPTHIKLLAALLAGSIREWRHQDEAESAHSLKRAQSMGAPR